MCRATNKSYLAVPIPRCVPTLDVLIPIIRVAPLRLMMPFTVLRMSAVPVPRSVTALHVLIPVIRVTPLHLIPLRRHQMPGSHPKENAFPSQLNSSGMF